MFRFFVIKKWLLWSWIGSFVILTSLWVQVKIDVEINKWFGEFYDMIQKLYLNLIQLQLKNTGKACFHLFH